MDFMVEEKNRDELAKYLKEIRARKHVGLNQLALKSGVQKTILSRLENSKILKINPFFLKQLSKALYVDYRELYRIVGYLEEEDFSKRDYKLESNYRELSVYGSKEANGFIDLKNDIRKEDIILFSGDEMPKDAFIIDIKGNSMHPVLTDGDIVIVDPFYDEFKDKGLYVVTYNGNTFIRRVLYREDYIQLVSDNQDRIKYPDIIIINKEGIDFECNGVVIESKRKFIR